MSGEKNLSAILKAISPELNRGEFVFCSLPDNSMIADADIISMFREKEGVTVIVNKLIADELAIPYAFVASWITLTVHSSLEAIGLTAAFSSALAKANISCNVIAGVYHDHIFVATGDARKAMEVLRNLSVSLPQ